MPRKLRIRRAGAGGQRPAAPSPAAIASSAAPRGSTPGAAAVRRPPPPTAPADRLARARRLGHRPPFAAPAAVANGPTLQSSRVKTWMPGDYTPPLAARLDPEQAEDLKAKTFAAEVKAGELLAEAHIAKWYVNAWFEGLMSGETSVEDARGEMIGEGVSPGHADNYINVVLKKKAGTGRMSPSTAGGYLVEDMATKNLDDSITQQGTALRNTRPDVIWSMGEVAGTGVEVAALMDITADSKAGYGHILRKGKGNWLRQQTYPVALEVLYDPLVTGPATVAPLSDDERQRLEELAADRVWQARELAELRRAALETNLDRLLSQLPPPEEFGRSRDLRSLESGGFKWIDGTWRHLKLYAEALDKLAEGDPELGDPDQYRSMRKQLMALHIVAKRLGIELVAWPTNEDVFQAEKRRREELDAPPTRKKRRVEED